ncbi:MAG: glycosyltransferase [Candidatus Jorgensenbacteria bacterium]|nr:glycosyltransferase [Candidatus Jorgensenbacteria bacterium]
MQKTRLKEIQVSWDGQALAVCGKEDAAHCKSITRAARRLKGLPVFHVSTTAYGGGVAEMLHSQIGFERAAGLQSRWFLFQAPGAFFKVTKKIHNLLQGKPGMLTAPEREYYLEVNHGAEASFRRMLGRTKNGLLVIHDPQPLPLVNFVPDGVASILRIHVDLSTPHAGTVEFLRPLIEKYRAVVVSHDDYLRELPWLSKTKSRIIYPAIDPAAPKNVPMAEATAQSVLEKLGIHPGRPMAVQVSRFDPWKDPLGVIKAYYLAKNAIPDLELVLAGLRFAADDPEAVEVFEEVTRHAKGSPADIHLFENPGQLGDISNDTFVSALYTAARVVVQKSLREGFGLTMTEAMWKGKPVVAGLTAGARVQITNGKNGILVASPEAAARAIVRLIRDPKLAARLGKAAHASVKRRFLLPRLVLDHMKLYSSLMKPSQR